MLSRTLSSQLPLLLLRAFGPFTLFPFFCAFGTLTFFSSVLLLAPYGLLPNVSFVIEDSPDRACR